IAQERLPPGREPSAELIQHLLELAHLLNAEGKHPEAVAAYAEVERVMSQAPAAVRENPLANWNIAHSYREISFQLASAGRLDESEQLLRKSVAIFEKLMTQRTSGPDWDFAADTHRRIGELMMQRKNLTEAEKEFRRAIEMYTQRVAKHPGEVVNNSERAAC